MRRIDPGDAPGVEHRCVVGYVDRCDDIGLGIVDGAPVDQVVGVRAGVGNVRQDGGVGRGYGGHGQDLRSMAWEQRGTPGAATGCSRPPIRTRHRTPSSTEYFRRNLVRCKTACLGDAESMQRALVHRGCGEPWVRWPTAAGPGYNATMPFTHNAPRRHHIPKARYPIRNWPADEAGLKRRGDLTLWIDETAVAGRAAPRRQSPGGQRLYSDRNNRAGADSAARVPSCAPPGRGVRQERAPVARPRSGCAGSNHP